LKRFALIENNAEQTEIQLKKLDQMGRYGELVTCRRKYLLNYFDEQASDRCNNCDVCLSDVELFDASVLAQKVISAVARLHEKYGAGYVIDFLRGSNSAKLQPEHKALKTFGIGGDMSKQAWSKIIQELVERGYLVKSDGLYPVLKLAHNSEGVLKGVHKVMLTKHKARSAEWSEISGTGLSYEHELYATLKEVRRELAARENIAAYIVLSDATLVEMAHYLPQTVDEIRMISGFGEVKVAKYGKPFLDQLTEYCTRMSLPSRMHLKAPKKFYIERPERDNETKQQSLAMYKEGRSIEEIAAQRKLSPLTIDSHLAFYVQQGKIPLEALMDSRKVPAIQAAIEQSGGTKLSPVKELLGDEYTFGEIRYVMAHMACSKVEELVSTEW
jgi:ATP-dependent DNA helicase RecQ